MKKILLILIVFLSLSGFAQDEKSINNSLNPELTCDSVRYFPETKIIEYLGNVKLHTDIIEIDKADKIVLDQTKQEIVATGMNEFTFDGVIHISSGADNKTVRYKLGERIAYIE